MTWENKYTLELHADSQKLRMWAVELALNAQGRIGVSGESLETLADRLIAYAIRQPVPRAEPEEGR